MRIRPDGIWLFAALLAFPGLAQAASMKECSAKYQAAKKAGSLNGQDWAAFRTAQCGGAPAAVATPAAAPAAGAPAAAAPAAPATAAAPTPSKAPSAAADSSGAVFPSAVASKYSSQKPGQQRMHTCLDQYKANKTSNANGGLKWIQKGGGYYSVCLKHLKGAA